MAEVIGLAASIVGLVSTALEVSRQVFAIRSAFSDSSPSTQIITDELDGIVAVLEELRNCISAPSLRPTLFEKLRESNLNVAGKSVRQTVSSINW